MTKKLGFFLLIVSFIMNLSAFVYLPDNFFTYLIIQVYMGVLVFCIAIGLIYYRNKIKEVWLQVVLLSGIFSALNVIVGLLTMPAVQSLAEKSSKGSLSVDVTPISSNIQILQMLVLNMVVTVSLCFAVMLILNRVSKFRTIRD